jgi:hypothetical protein
MKAIKLIIFLQLFSIANCYSNDGPYVSLDTVQERSLKTSDLIFLGKLIKTDTLKETLVFKILEVFKGKIAQDTVEIKWEEHTYIYSFDYSLWIVYSNQKSNASYVLNGNGLTRSIINPQLIWSYLPPPPSLKDDLNTTFITNLKWIDYKVEPLKDWYAELEMLREYRKKNIASTENDNFAYKPYFYISIILNLICIALIVFVYLRLKKKAYR